MRAHEIQVYVGFGQLSSQISQHSDWAAMADNRSISAVPLTVRFWHAALIAPCYSKAVIRWELVVYVSISVRFGIHSRYEYFVPQAEVQVCPQLFQADARLN